MDQINKQVSLGTVTAPCAGTLTVVNLVAGGMAASAQPAVIIAENGKVEVQVSVAEDVYTNIKEGENADVVISVLGDTVIHGTIGPLPAAANMQTSLYDISVALPDTVTPPIGAFATVTFYTNRRAEALHVPTEALLTGENDEQYVFVVDDFGDGETVTRVTVETGLVGKTDTEIVSGLSEGDRVVVKGQSYLTDGEAVRVVTGEAGLAPEGGSDDIADGGSDDAADGGEG